MAGVDLGFRRSQARWYDGLSRYLALIVAAIALVTTAVVLLTIGKKLGGVGELVTAAIGVLGLVVSLEIEVLFRVAERARARDRYSRLLEMVEDYPKLLTLATSVLEAGVLTCNRTKTDLFRDEVRNTLTRAEIRLQEMAQGRLRTTDGDGRPMMARFGEAERSIQAVTDDNDVQWWLEGSGVQFLELNKKLIDGRKLTIERVWIFYRPLTEDTREALRRQHAAHIKVFMLHASNCDLDRRYLVNMTIMDGAFLHEDLPNKQGNAVEYLYSENAADLVRCGNTFAKLKRSAKRYDGDSSLNEFFSIAGTTLGRPLSRLPNTGV